MLQLLGKQNRKTKCKQITLFAFQNSLPTICSYLSKHDILSLKVVCRAFYYRLIVGEIWKGLKMIVADQKLDFYDDLEFEDNEPQQISKESCKIRMRSLKKGHSIKRPRQASNIKQAKTALLNQENLFNSTQLGFRRLLKTKTQKTKPIENLTELVNFLQIPKTYKPSDLIINPCDGWSVNIRRSANLCLVLEQWNRFHSQFRLLMHQTYSDFKNFNQILSQIDAVLFKYRKKMEEQPYLSICEYVRGAVKGLLIEQNLNKLGLVFIQNHNFSIKISEQMTSLIQSTHDAYVRTIFKVCPDDQIECSQMAQHLAAVEQTLCNLCDILEPNSIIAQLFSLSLGSIYQCLLQKAICKTIQADNYKFKIQEISYSILVNKPEIIQLIFQILANIYKKISKLVSNSQAKPIHANNQQQICQYVYSVAKYFLKLSQQLSSKKKNREIVLAFCNKYQVNPLVWSLHCRDPEKFRRQIVQFKAAVTTLKQKMHQ